MNPVEIPCGAPAAAGVLSTPEEAWIALSKLDPARIILILTNVIAKCLDNLAPDERRAVERDLAVQRLGAERAASLERSLATGEKMVAIKENLTAVARVAAANPENDPERIQEMWRQDRLWCHRMGIDFDDTQTRNLFLEALNYCLQLAEKVLCRIDVLHSSFLLLHFVASKIRKAYRRFLELKDSSGHLLIASCHVTRGPDAGLASFLPVAA
jgi:hypothetical protein